MSDTFDHELDALLDGFERADGEDVFRWRRYRSYHAPRWIMCKRCYRNGLTWMQTNTGWRLFEKGVKHECPPDTSGLEVWKPDQGVNHERQRNKQKVIRETKS
jgi:hypothetical protein